MNDHEKGSPPEPEADVPARPSLPSTAVSLDLAAPETLIGTLLAGRYRVDELVGQGGMSVIYRAEHVHMRKSFAVKVLHEQLSRVPEVVARFEREAIAAASIEHPNVAAATDFGRLGDGSFYLVLEYIEGESLAQLLASCEPLEPRRAVHIGRQIADALVVAHAQRIVHRDLKPDNVMLVKRAEDADFVKVLDFGIAKVVADEGGPALTQLGSVFGTPNYMSPEQALGTVVDYRADLYSLGVVLFEMLTGEPPFDSSDVGILLKMHIDAPPPELPPTLDGELAELVRGLLAKSPEDRPQSAAEVVDSLEAVELRLSGFSASLRAPEALPRGGGAATSEERERLGRLARHPLLVAAGGGMLLGALWGVIALVSPGEPQEAVEQAREPAGKPAQPPPSSRIPKLPREVLVARAAVGDSEALTLLRQKAERDPQGEAWLALGRGYMKREQPVEAMRSYERAVTLQPKLAEDAVTQRDVLAAAKLEQSVEPALRVASHLLGSAGADILYEVWVGTAQKTPTTQLARQLVYDPDVRKQASPGLEVALELRLATRCQDYESLLPRVILHGDRRVVRLVKPLQRVAGCGPGKRDDCYPCLRDDDELLEAALEQAQRRPAPRLAF